MKDYLLSMAVSILLTTLKEAVKNPESKHQLKSVMLKIYTQIGLLYIGDVDFNPSLDLSAEKSSSLSADGGDRQEVSTSSVTKEQQSLKSGTVWRTRIPPG